jgi:hypothetical protein
MPTAQRTKTIRDGKIFRHFRYFLYILIFSLIFSEHVFAQDETSGIFLRPYYEQEDLGIFFSLGEAYSPGTLLAECPNCRFEEAVGSQITIGAEYFFFVNDWFFAGVVGYYNYFSLTSKFWETETIELQEYQGESVDVSFRHRADLESNGIRGGGFAGVRLGKWLYFKAGMSAGLNIQENFRHEKSIRTRTATLSNGEIVIIGINPDKGSILPGSTTSTALLQDSGYPDMGIPVFADFSFGMNVGIKDYFYLFPQLQYSKSLNTFSSYGEDLYLDNWSIKLELIINRKLINR